MMSDQGLREEIDRSFGSGPDPHPPVEQRIGAGRRALARRRTSAAAAVLAVVATAGVGYAALAPSAPGGAREIATAPQPSGPTPDAVPRAGDDRWRDALRLAGDGTVVPSPGSQVLQRTDDPRLGDAFAPPGTPTGAALVDPARSRDVSCLVWRVVDGELEVFRVPPGDVVGATFQELLAHVRGLYASGEELG
jgi:hypothetical protein